MTQTEVSPTPTLPSPFLSTVFQPTIRPSLQPTLQPSALPSSQPTVLPLSFGPLTTPGTDLLAGPVAVPLELEIPALQINAPVVGVGLTSDGVMDSPRGPIDDPVWQQVFWYRGGGVPGDSGTATFAGHVNDGLGRPAVFARLNELQPGDSIVVRDPRSGHTVLFLVTEVEVYTLPETTNPAILQQVYGAGPVAGQGPQPASDGLSHLALVTCSGDFVGSSYDHRLVVYATQSP